MRRNLSAVSLTPPNSGTFYAVYLGREGGPWIDEYRVRRGMVEYKDHKTGTWDYSGVDPYWLCRLNADYYIKDKELAE